MKRQTSFIETQFPISKLSKESYKERKANYSQTLTGLGKWWGRKPLILVRATLLGLLMPASDDPKKDREIFLKLLTMDAEGLWRRKTKAIPLKVVYERLTPHEREAWFELPISGTFKDKFLSDNTPLPPSRGDLGVRGDLNSNETPLSVNSPLEGGQGGVTTGSSAPPKLKLKKGLSKAAREELQRIVFNRLSYDDKLTYCDRPEQLDGPAPAAWEEINAHLGTHAGSLPELVQELGERRFGHPPRVGDAFCGGGSIPFEAARLGCDVYASDLNPVAALLTWAALNIIGGGSTVAEQVRQAQQTVYDAVDQQITAWGIEQNEQGWRADAYLYCAETVCPECGWRVPLAPSWVIGEKTRTIARLVPDCDHQRFEIQIESGVTPQAIKQAKLAGTIKNSYLLCPNPACGKSTPVSMLRDQHLRLWEKEDIVPQPDDLFQERLYCIRWVETYLDEESNPQTLRHYRAPDAADWVREATVLKLLQARFQDWQAQGYIPERRIEPGDKTDEPIRTRGWTHWHHLFTPRQLLLIGTFSHIIQNQLNDRIRKIACILGLNRVINYNSKLSAWDSTISKEMVVWIFSNQALNTLFNHGSRGFIATNTSWFYQIFTNNITVKHEICPTNAKEVSETCSIWITDPPYADAINYHELTEFYLGWLVKIIPEMFPTWYTDSKRALAITGFDEFFRQNMVESYRNLTQNMPDNGMQVVMFTHQNASVWADLALIMWASGLRVAAAWTIATEMESALKQGNYVKGTVLLVLRKQTSEETAFFDELYPEVEQAVKAQLAAMLALEDQEDPNFDDADYQLAAYAAALRVLTQYKQIEGFDIAYELTRPRKKGETSPVEAIIANAVKIACDYLIPAGFESFTWKTLSSAERFYLKGLEIESHGEYRSGVYQELARGFGIGDYKALLASGQANQTRLKTASELGTKLLGREDGFGSSTVRNVLFAIREVVKQDNVLPGKNWLRQEIPDYWTRRATLIEILSYLAALGLKIPHWQTAAAAARLLAGAVENDHV